MKKEFKVSVPDEIWIDSWTENKEETYVYNGPDVIYVKAARNGIVKEWYETEDVEVQDGERIRKIDANEQPEIAHWFVSDNEEHEYKYRTITNHDGSNHEEFTNPTLHDYFDMEYTFNEDKFRLDPVYKETETIQEQTAKTRLAFLKKYDDYYDFDDETQAKIDQTKKKFNEYLKMMETVYPWKYVEISNKDIPKIPASLVKTFSELPDLDGGV